MNTWPMKFARQHPGLRQPSWVHTPTSRDDLRPSQVDLGALKEPSIVGRGPNDVMYLSGDDVNLNRVN